MQKNAQANRKPCTLYGQCKKTYTFNYNALYKLTANVFDGTAWRRLSLNTFWIIPSTCPHAKQKNKRNNKLSIQMHSICSMQKCPQQNESSAAKNFQFKCALYAQCKSVRRYCVETPLLEHILDASRHMPTRKTNT